MSKIIQTNFNGDPNLGIYGFATDKYCLLGIKLANPAKIESALGVKIIRCPFFGTEISGIFSAGNSCGMAVPSSIEEEEIAILEKKTRVLRLETKYTALGNLMLMNDKGCIISRLIKEEKSCIERFFGIECHIFDSVIGVVGSAALANNRGCIVHPNLGEREVAQISRALAVDCQPGTANFGSPFVGSCSIANSRGIVASEQSTGIEVSRMEEILLGIEQ